MASTWHPVTTPEELEAHFADSGSSPTILFNHDPFCPISAYANRQMKQVAADVYMIDVARANHLAQQLAQRTGVKHESPQVIIMVKGQAVWSKSHRAITQEAVDQAFQQAQDRGAAE